MSFLWVLQVIPTSQNMLVGEFCPVWNRFPYQDKLILTYWWVNEWWIIYTIRTEVCGHLTITPICGPSSHCWQKIWTQLYKLTCCSIIIYFQWNCGAGSNMTIPLCTMQCSWTHDVLMSDWKSVLHRALTLALLNTLGTNWNDDCTSGLFTQTQCLTH